MSEAEKRDRINLTVIPFDARAKKAKATLDEASAVGFDTVIVVGLDSNGCLRWMTNIDNGPDALWLLERMRWQVLGEVDTGTR